MVNVSIDVTDLGGEARPGDKVVFWRPRMGGSATHAGRVISTAPVTVFLTDGKATVSDVEPGEMTVLLQCRGVESQGPVTVGVPDGNGTVTLRALLEAQFEYSPPVVSAVQEAADNAAASERAAIQAQVRSERAADRAEDRVDEAINNGANLIRAEVKQDADRAVAAKNDAQAAQSAAELARDGAQTAPSSTVTDIHAELDGLVAAADGHASRAESAADTAAGETIVQVRSEFEGMLSGAESARDAAGVSETNAAQSENDAAGYADLAEQYKTAAELARDDAAQSKADAALSASAADGDAGAAAASASNAAQSESSAATHAQSALGYAGQSEAARDESRLARDEAVQAAENAQQGAPPDGWKKSELAQPVQDSLSRADTALQSIPVATESAPGAIRLSGDLGGTAQTPTVPGLAGKADSVHTHEIEQINGLDGALGGKAEVSHDHTSSQVDGLDAALARLGNIRAWFRGEGSPPASIPGAQVGDWWLDTTTMELHEITGTGANPPHFTPRGYTLVRVDDWAITDPDVGTNIPVEETGPVGIHVTWEGETEMALVLIDSGGERRVIATGQKSIRYTLGASAGDLLTVTGTSAPFPASDSHLRGTLRIFPVGTY